MVAGLEARKEVLGLWSGVQYILRVEAEHLAGSRVHRSVLECSPLA